MSHHRIHSALVRLWLESEEGRIPLAQVGPDFIITTSPVDRLEIISGEVVVEVDGDALRHHVRLPQGVKHRDALTPVENLD